MVVIRSILLRSPVAVGVILILILEITSALGNTTPGFNLWADRINGLTNTSILAAVVAAGVSALEANRWQASNRVRLRTASRSHLRVRSYHAGAVLLPLALAFWVAVAAVAAHAAFTGTYGAPSMLWLVSLCCAIVLAGTIGYVVGSVLPHRWYVGPAAALALYAAYVLLLASRAPYGIVSLFPASSNYDSVFTRKILATLGSQSIFFLSLSALLLLLLGLKTIPLLRNLFLAAPFVILVVASGLTVITTNGQVTTGNNPRDFICVGERPTLCLNPGYAAAIDPLQSEYRRFADLTAGTPLAPERLEQNVQGIGDEPVAGSRSAYLEQWAAPDDLTFSVFRYVKKYGSASQCSNAEGSYYGAEVDSWLSNFYESTDGSAANAVSRALAEQTPEQGTAWFRAHYDSYASCSLTANDMP